MQPNSIANQPTSTSNSTNFNLKSLNLITTYINHRKKHMLYHSKHHQNTHHTQIPLSSAPSSLSKHRKSSLNSNPPKSSKNLVKFSTPMAPRCVPRCVSPGARAPLPGRHLLRHLRARRARPRRSPRRLRRPRGPTTSQEALNKNMFTIDRRNWKYMEIMRLNSGF